jgi:L-rhamnose isomerase/sugar isomerase
MILSVLNCQEAYCKSLIVPRAKWQAAQGNGDVLGAHEIINNAYKTDVRPLLQQVRAELNVPTDPLAAYRRSGCVTDRRPRDWQRGPAAGEFGATLNAALAPLCSWGEQHMERIARLHQEEPA